MNFIYKFCISLLVILLATACSKAEDNAILELKASLDACDTREEPQEEANLENLSKGLKSVNATLDCAKNAGDKFFVAQCGKEKAMTNIMSFAMTKAFAAAISGDEDANTKLVYEDVRNLEGDCVAEYWRKLEEMEKNSSGD